MGALLDVIKQIFSSVFGHRDIVHLLEDDFEMDPSMRPGSGPSDLHRRAEQGRRKGRRRRQPAPPTPLSATVAAGIARDTYSSASSIEIPDIDAFDWSGEFPAESDAEDVAEADADSATRTAIRAPGTVRLTRQPAPPQDDFAAQQMTVEATGVAPPAHPSLDLAANSAPLLRSSDVPPRGGSVSSSLRMAVRLSSAARVVEAEASRADYEPPPPVRWGPPPSTLWEEEVIRAELFEQVAEEKKHAPDGIRERSWRRVVTRLQRALTDLDRELPPLPSAAGRLLGVGGNTPNDEEVIEAIKADPVLAGRLIKAANSPFYMAAAPASSLQAAIVRMGLAEARRVAIAAAFEETFDLDDQAEALGALRAHALATAVAGEIIARSARAVDSGEAFLAGLLHDAGELLVLRMLADPSGSQEPLDPDACKVLAERLHQRMGALLFGEWDLDAGVAATLGWHHCPDVVEERFAPLCHIVHVADLLAEVALAHKRSDAWKSAAHLYSEQDDPTARDRAVAADGIDELDIASLLPLTPPGFGGERIRSVIRGVLLRLETSPV